MRRKIDININKSAFRESCKKVLKKSSNFASLKKNSQILEVLKNIILLHSPKEIFLYISFGFEFDTRKLIIYCRRKKIKIYVPFMQEISFKMVKYQSPLLRNRYGIFEPTTREVSLKKPTLAIVPIIGVDTTLRRVGFGKGGYDRYFDRFYLKPFVVFVQKELCYIDKNITKEHDIGADLVVTPKKILKKRGNRDGIRAYSCWRSFKLSSSNSDIFCYKKAKLRKLQDSYRTSKS